jgi:hypothetical protein
MKRPGIILCLLILFAAGEAYSQDDPFAPVIEAIEAGDAKKVAACFNETVELGFPGKENTCSISQGEMILKDFFRNNPPASFLILQNGTTDASSRFVIGDYRSGPKTFQAYIQLRQVKGKFLIQKMKFEEKKN